MPGDDALDALVSRMWATGTLRTPEVEDAIRTIRRDDFVPESWRADAWADRALPVKHRGDELISTISQPSMVVTMLEMAAFAPGQRVLEIGTATGYNTALVATMVGATGRVVTIEIEPDLAATAATRLDAIPDLRVDVIVGDGAAGHAPLAPYDRIIATAGVADVPAQWVAQLRDGGRLVVPIVDEDGVGVVRCLEQDGDVLRPLAEAPCGFLHLR